MSSLVSIDPGLRVCGVAAFEDKLLTRCGTARWDKGSGPEQWVGMAAAVSCLLGDSWRIDPETLAIEKMVTRRGRSDAHSALIELSQVSGAIYALVSASEPVAVAPQDWTKGRPKRINHRRVRYRLSKQETRILDEALEDTKRENQKEVLDAVCIGLHVLGRWR